MSSKTAPKSPPRQKSAREPARKSGRPAQLPTASDSNTLIPATRQAGPTAQRRRQAMAREAALRRERQKSARTVGVLAAIVLVVGVATFLFSMREYFKPGQYVEMQASHPHITGPNGPHPPYTTDPPTSGPHYDSLPSWVVYTAPITKELQVHGLEDGGVIVNYRPGLDKVVVDRLAALAQSYEQLPDPNRRVVMAPYPGLSNTIVLTAWRRIDRLDTFDEARIKRFVDEYVGIDRHKESAEGPSIPVGELGIAPTPTP